MTTVGAVRIDAGAISLEGRLYRPASSGDSVVVVCHPHPQRSGDLDNNVVLVAVDALTSAGIAALTFNFRGVGQSDGSFGNGAGEQDDVRAAMAYARSLDGVERVALAGYSFGAGMAAGAVEDSKAKAPMRSGAEHPERFNRIEALALISIPEGALNREIETLQRFKGPLLLVSGSEDNASTTPALRHAVTRLGDRAELVIVPGAGHFWWGYEAALSEAIDRFFGRALVARAMDP